MATTLEQLEQRLAALENDLRALRASLQPKPTQETPLERAKKWLHASRATQNSPSPALDAVFERLGATGEPVGAEKVQEMMIAQGIKPENCTLSREIMAMREE